MDNIFDILGGGPRPHVPQPGTDLFMRIMILPENAVTGTDREIEFLHTEPCTFCNGSGNESKHPNTCPNCKGSGQIRKVTNLSLFGEFVRQYRCTQCEGKGKIPEKVCQQCLGTGHTQVKKKVSIHIPAGIETGMRLRLVGMGEAGDYGQKNGDLFIEAYIQSDANRVKEK